MIVTKIKVVTKTATAANKARIRYTIPKNLTILDKAELLSGCKSMKGLSVCFIK